MYERVWSGASKISQFFASPRERILFNEKRKREKDKEIYIYIEGESERERWKAASWWLSAREVKFPGSPSKEAGNSMWNRPVTVIILYGDDRARVAPTGEDVQNFLAPPRRQRAYSELITITMRVHFSSTWSNRKSARHASSPRRVVACPSADDDVWFKSMETAEYVK